MEKQQVITTKVIVQLPVYLNVIDHYKNVAKIGHKKRVVGVLLGSWQATGILDVSNSFAVSFGEDDFDKTAWFLDHDYVKNMSENFKKIYPHVKIVGWYHTGPKLHQNDIDINELIRRYCPNPVLVIINVKANDFSSLTEVYHLVEQVHNDGSLSSKKFEAVPSESAGTISQHVTNMLQNLKSLTSQLREVMNCLAQVEQGELTINHHIVDKSHVIFNHLPDIQEVLPNSLHEKMYRQLLVVYLATMVNSTAALNNLLAKKLTNEDAAGKKGESDKKAESNK